MDNFNDSADSDDEILGISHTPVKIKTLTKRSTNKWTHCSRNKRKKSPRNDFTSISQQITHFPSTEIIEISNNSNKVSKYQRMKEVKNVRGFIVNIHDAANFDIDLNIIPELHERYHNVISNQYTYQDLSPDFFDDPSFSQLKITPEVGTTYRCRLKGIGINQLPPNEYTWKSNELCVDVKKLIDRTDCWVICNLSDIDVYQRLLVDIIVHTYTGPINLREFLLSKMENEDNPLFYPYNCRRSTILHTA